MRWILFILFLGVLAAGASFLPHFLSAPLRPQALLHAPVEDRLTRMSLEEKIGQLLIVGFENPYLDNHIREMITKRHIGGVNLLARNVQDKAQIASLIRNLKLLDLSSTDIPLIVAADQEGGPIVRFPFLKELTPQTKILNATSAEQIAYARGRELKEIGVNMNFAPLADYVTSSKAYLWPRVFHGTVKEVTERAGAMLRGYSRAKIVPVLKHFPGYGNSTPDPHSSSTLLTLSPPVLEANLSPFRDLLRTPDVPALMTAHIIIPSVDSKPATLSPRFMEMLRREWGYSKVIITDDLEMASTGLPPEKAAIAALKAGADMFISTKTPAVQIAIFDALKNALVRGEISEERLDESVRRVLALKAGL